MSVDADIVDRMIAWRRDLHAHPELAFAEHRTSDLVARELAACGLEVHRGLGGTGVVGTLRRGNGPAIGLRADMDALPIQEATGLPYASTQAGVMHACGHDGHVAMLLCAAAQLARAPALGSTVHFIFQPAEECEGGGRAMVEDGLFEIFPCQSVWGMHNWPGLPLGEVATRSGAIMASLDTFEIRVRGSGSHAAMPEQGIDTLVMASEMVLALQTIASRRVSPLDPVVVSVTQVHGGDAYNVIPDRAVIRGTVRCLSEEVRARIPALMTDLACGIARSHGGSAEVDYRSGYPPTINSDDAVPVALAAAEAVAAIPATHGTARPSMGSEDFSYMLQVCPGAYVWLGADGETKSAPLHNPHYDFNDDALAIGAAYWVSLVHEASRR